MFLQKSWKNKRGRLVLGLFLFFKKALHEVALNLAYNKNKLYKI